MNTTNETPMYEMPLIYVLGFGDLGFGVGVNIFCIGGFGNGILSLAVCHEINVDM